MLFLTLALSFAAPAATVVPDAQRVQNAPAVRRTTRARVRARTAARTPQLRMTATCGLGLTCAGAGTSMRDTRRLTPSDYARPDFKNRVVERNAGMACGTTGAPVCPGNGMTFVRAPID